MSNGVLDVSALPKYGFGHRSPMWWGTVGLIAIEGTMFALLIASYVYLRGRTPDWPPGVSPPSLVWGTVNLILLLVSAVPNQLAKRASERLDLRPVRLWLLVCVAFGIVMTGVRALEFWTLNVWWDENAYGSIVWALLGFHTAHVVTDVIDTAVLAVLMYTGPLEESRFVDVSENAMYWYFVLAAWIPVYGVIYLLPRVW